MNEVPRQTSATAQSFFDMVSGFSHRTLSERPSYRRFREALADLIDESEAPLSRMLNDVRSCALSSPFGSMCVTCGATSWPSRGNRRGQKFVGHYECTCGGTFAASHDLTDVDWPNG